MPTKIQWTQNADGSQGETWNPIGGCFKVSPGCARCYAIRQAHRLGGNPNEKIAKRYKGLTVIQGGAPNWTGKTFIDEEVLLQPLQRRKPTTYFISLSDLFFDKRPDEDIDRVFAVMALCPQHTFQILTKYADRMLRYLTLDLMACRIAELAMLYRFTSSFDSDYEFDAREAELDTWPLPNVHLGVSVENRAQLGRIDILKRTPASLRFVSFEPLLEHLGDLSAYLPGIDWAIWGGESGPGARPCPVDAIRDGVRQCRIHRVAPFVKQLGAVPVIEPCRQHHWDFGGAIGREAKFSPVDPMHPSTEKWRIHFADKKGGEMSEWAEDLRVREMPAL